MNKHPYARGFAALPLIIILALVLVGGGAYIYFTTPIVIVEIPGVPSKQPQQLPWPFPQRPVMYEEGSASNYTVPQNTKGEIFSLTITPSTKDQIWTNYRSGAKAVVRGKNLSSVEVRYVYTGTEVREISSAGNMSKISESSQEQVWELTLPNSLLTTRFWAEAKDLTGQDVKSVDLGNVGYDDTGSITKKFTDPNLKVSFRYPSSWNLKTNFQIGFGPKDGIQGKYGEICRTQDNEFCFAKFYSSDYTFYGMDSSGQTIFLGVGEQANTILGRCPSLAISCEQKRINGRQTIDIVSAYKDESGTLRTRRLVFISDPNATYTGIALMIPLNSLDKKTLTALPGSIAEKELYVKEVSDRIKVGNLTSAEKDFMAGMDMILKTFSFDLS